MLSTPKSKGELFLASSLRDGLEDNDIRQVKTLLLNKEADPNVLIPTHGISPFHLVIGNESETFAEEVTKLFLRHGGNPNVKSTDGMTPVHVAAAWGRINVLELLLANGGDPLCLDDDGRSPFHYAFDGNFYNAVTMLGKYCGMSQDEEEDEPKYKLTLDKILINKGNVVAEYVPSEDSSCISIKTETSDKIEKFKTEEAPKLSPINLKDSSSEIETSREEEYSHLKTNNITHRRYQKRRIESPFEKNFNVARSYERSAEDERFLIGEIISRLSNTFVNNSLNSDNTTCTNERSVLSNKAINLSGIKKTRSYLPPPKYHSHNLKFTVTPDRNFFHTSIISKSPNIRLFQNEKTLSQSRKNNFKSTITTDTKICDTSIISKSPNIRLFANVKTPTSSKRKILSPRSYTCRSRYWNNNVTPPLKNAKPEIRIKSASSTPKKKQYSGGFYNDTKLLKNKKRTNNHSSRKSKDSTPTILDKTYNKDRFGIHVYSPDTEIYTRRLNRKYLAKNIVINLHDRMYDDNEENERFNDSETEANEHQTSFESPSKNKITKLKPLRIYNNIKSILTDNNDKTKRCNIATSKSNFASPKNQLKQEKFNNFSISRETTPKSKEIDIELEEKNLDNVEEIKRFLDSPGSSIPRSAYSYYGTQGDDNEDTKILMEIEDACRNKCVTPPASVSIITADNSPSSSPGSTTGTTFYSDYGSEDPNNSDFCEISTNNYPAFPNQLIMTSRSDSESLVSVEEEYLYEDAEEGVAFIERHLCVIPSSDERNRDDVEDSLIDRLEELSLITSDYSSVSSTTERRLSRSFLDDKILRERLTALGEKPGPITKTTINVYLKRLWKLERAQKNQCPPKSNDPSKSIEDQEKQRRQLNLNLNGENTSMIVSSAIPDFLLSIDWIEKETIYRSLEEQAFKEYATANPTRKYRGGISKTSFCYLLLDPRVTRDLPRCGVQLSVEDRWKKFLNGVFYVGKGKAARPAAHLYDAFGVWSKRKNIDNISRKIRRILDIWQDGQGVVCLHVFSHTMMEEACSREASMIDALETTHLTNCVRGTYYGYTTTMNSQEKRSLGKYLLYKSMEIFMHEGERQLFPRNVIM